MENNEFISGYDLATEIVSRNQTYTKSYLLAKEFLEFQTEHELLCGDDDNPFNPLVSDYIRKEEDFINAINQLQI